MFWTFLLALLAALGLVSLSYWFLQALSYRMGEEDICHVVRLFGDAAETEQRIKSCLRRKEDRSLVGRLIFLDEGLLPEGQIAAQLLLREREDAVLCSPEQIYEMIDWEREDSGAGTHQRQHCRSGL